MQGLRPLFSTVKINKRIDDFAFDKETRILYTLIYAGEQFINLARERGDYTDRTGNLRSSIGYAVVKDKKIINQGFFVSGNEGVKEAKNAINEVLKGIKDKGFYLIGVAGMGYAGYVEAMGYDVITGSISPSINIIRRLLDKIGK